MKEILDLHAFADGELSPKESREMRNFISANPKAQEELDAISNLIDCLGQRSSMHRSEECWNACVVRLNQLDRSKKVEFFVGKYAWAMCLILFSLVIGGRYAVKDARGDSAHVADVFQFHSSPGNGTQQIENQQLYAELLRDARRARSGVRVVREDSGMVLDTPVAREDLVDSKGPLTFFVMKGQFNFEDASQMSSGSEFSHGVISSPSVNGTSVVNCVIWVDNGETFVLAGPRSVSDLGHVAEVLKSP